MLRSFVDPEKRPRPSNLEFTSRISTIAIRNKTEAKYIESFVSNVPDGKLQDLPKIRGTQNSNW